MDTKERWTPVRGARFNPPDPRWHPAPPLCGEKEMENAVTVSRASMNFLCRFDSRPVGESLHFLLNGRSQPQQPLPLIAGQVSQRQQFLTVQEDAALTFNEKGTHAFGKRPLAPEGGRPGCRFGHFRPRSVSADAG